MTVAMHIAKYLKCDIPDYWYHDPAIKNIDGQLVRDILISKRKYVSDLWLIND